MEKLGWMLVLGFLIAGCTQTDHSDKNHVSGMKNDSTGIVATEKPQAGTTITFKGNPVHTIGKLPAVGTQAPDFTLVATDLSDKTLKDYSGKNIILNIFISVNTGVCSASVHEFNKDAASLKNTVVLCISKDLPFGQEQFCGAAGIHDVVMLSDFRNDFGKLYGVQMVDGKFRGLLSRAVVVINPQGKIVYEQQVPELSHEPDYAAALAAVRSGT
jgi:thiol peroxidase